MSLCFVGGRPDSLTDGNREEEKGEISSLKQKHHELAGQHLTSFYVGLFFYSFILFFVCLFFSSIGGLCS